MVQHRSFLLPVIRSACFSQSILCEKWMLLFLSSSFPSYGGVSCVSLGETRGHHVSSLDAFPYQGRQGYLWADRVRRRESDYGQDCGCCIQRFGRRYLFHGVGPWLALFFATL